MSEIRKMRTEKDFVRISDLSLDAFQQLVNRIVDDRIVGIKKENERVLKRLDRAEERLVRFQHFTSELETQLNLADNDLTSEDVNVKYTLQTLIRKVQNNIVELDLFYALDLSDDEEYGSVDAPNGDITNSRSSTRVVGVDMGGRDIGVRVEVDSINGTARVVRSPLITELARQIREGNPLDDVFERILLSPLDDDNINDFEE